MRSNRRSSLRKRSRNSEYVRGTSPLRYAEDTEYEQQTRKTSRTPQRKRTANGTGSAARGKIVVLYKRVQEEVPLQIMFYSAVLILIFGVFMCLILYFNAETRHTQRELSNLKDTLQNIEEKNVYYETEISNSIDLELVEKTAKMRLDMSEPAAHQKKYINVPKQSFVTQNKE